ncbi:unnamed protein product [Amoebophrya sp. A25]|nr:unnamed protein product [Amoebophrya sp. A25]|eukprot:GSA25T00020807001.1
MSNIMLILLSFIIAYATYYASETVQSIVIIINQHKILRPRRFKFGQDTGTDQTQFSATEEFTKSVMHSHSRSHAFLLIRHERFLFTDHQSIQGLITHSRFDHVRIHRFNCELFISASV